MADDDRILLASIADTFRRHVSSGARVAGQEASAIAKLVEKATKAASSSPNAFVPR
jgi:hypothetical protein